MASVGGIKTLFRELGCRDATSTLIHAMVDRAMDRWFRVSTLAGEELGDSGLANLANRDYVDYAPVDYWSFWRAMRRVRVEPGRGEVFVDYGAGRGRVLIAACLWPFGEVIGIELVPELAAGARKNLNRAKPKLRGTPYRVLTGDALDFELPAEATVLHFYNPFRGEALLHVTRRVADSLRRAPRQLTVLFANPDDFERILGEEGVVPALWVKSIEVVPWPFYHHNGLGNIYRVYTLDSTVATGPSLATPDQRRI